MDRTTRRILWIGIPALFAMLVLIAGIAVALIFWSTMRAKTWTPYTSAQGKFKVLFPGEVRETSQTSGGGVNVETDHTVSSTGPGDVYMSITWTDLSPNDVKESGDEEIVDRYARVNSSFSTVISEDKSMRHGLHARAIELKGGFDSLRHRELILIKGNRLYTVSGSGPDSNNTRKELDQFFDSFDVTN